MSKYILTLSFSLFALLLSQAGYAQKTRPPVNPRKYHKGYVITLDGDTLEGYVNYKNYLYLKLMDPNGGKRKFTASKVNGFGDYELNRHMESFFIGHRENTYFLERIISGTVPLYFNYEHVDRYFLETSTIVTAGGTLLLSFLNNVNARNRFSAFYFAKEGELFAIPVARKPFISVLAEHLADHTALVDGMVNGEYQFEDLVYLFETYNAFRD